VLLAECDVPARSVGGGETLLDINWVPLYEDWEVGIKRILSVIKPIPPEIQNLISALRSEDRDVRDRAFKALHKIGDPSSVPGLIEALKDEDFRKTAAKDIRKIGPEAKAAVPALSEVLKDKNILVRTEAARALGQIGSEAKAAVPALVEALKDEYAIIRLLAADALGKIGPEAKAAVSALVETLKDEKEDVRWYSAKALKKINTPEALKALEEYRKKSV
jgi:HEAT repeat protein